MTGDTASDIVIAMKMLEKDWDSYDTAIYTDCAGDVWRRILCDTKPTTTLKPPWTDTGTHTLELTGQKTGDTASDDAIAMKTLEKYWDSYDTAIYTDCAATQTVVAVSLSTLAPQVTLESTVSELFFTYRNCHKLNNAGF